MLQRLHQRHVHALRQAADIVVRLDRHGGAAGERHRFNDIGIERALGEELRRLAAGGELVGLRLEGLDEQAADGLALCFRIALALKGADEGIAGIDMDERDVVVAAEQGDDLVGLVEAHQPVIDEDTGEPFADRLVDQDGGDGGIDAAGEAADHAAVADLFPDPGNRLLAERRHRPVAGKAGDTVDEIGKQLRAVGRVHDLRMELHPVDAELAVLDRRERRAVGPGDDAETRPAGRSPCRRGSSRPGGGSRRPRRRQRAGCLR